LSGSEWLANREPELRPKTVSDYQWALSYHLLPHFAEQRVAAITAVDVDRYKAAKLAEGRIAGAQVNKTLRLLAQILDVAGEYGFLTGANPARGRRRRVKATRPQRTWVEPEQLMALLDNAPDRLRPVLATLAGAGLRVGEDMPGGLLDALKEHKANSEATGPGDPVFTTRSIKGRSSRQSDGNIRESLKVTIRRANDQLDQLGIEPISERVSPHSLRRTYASVRAALRDDPVYIAEQLGHEDATFTFRLYQRAVKRRGRLTGSYLEAFDRALDWALMSTGTVVELDQGRTERSQADAELRTVKR
jgi:integrase